MEGRQCSIVYPQIEIMCLIWPSHWINPFTAKGFPIDEYNRLALDRVKSISVMSAPTDLKGLVFDFVNWVV